MNTQTALIFFLCFVLLPGGYYLFMSFFSRENSARNLIFRQEEVPVAQTEWNDIQEAPNSQVIQKAGNRYNYQNAPSQNMPAFEERLFRAGYLRDDDRKLFRMLQFVAPGILGVLFLFLMSSIGSYGSYLGIVFGVLLGFYLPQWYLDRAITIRDEEIMYYLPLVVEQLIIGVSSGLDIGPCIQRVVAVADERDTHNPVTELLRNVQLLTKSGNSLNEALEEIGTLAGHTELKHSFMTLGQVSRHGGEITKQLQELANAVSSQRETKIEARVKRLELHATGPVVLVFLSFMAVLFIGIGLQLMKAL